MWRNLLRSSFAITELKELFSTYDKPTGRSPTELAAAEINEETSSIQESTTTGWQRLVAVFQLEDGKTPNKEFLFMKDMMFSSGFIGFVAGGFYETRNVLPDFVKRLDAMAFNSPHEARRLLADHSIYRFIKGGFKYGWKMCAFCSVFWSATTLMSVYRGSHHATDFTFGGVCAGAVYKWSMGPRGMFAGGVIAGLIGTVFGTLVTVGLYTANVRYEDMFHMHCALHARIKAVNDSLFYTTDSFAMLVLDWSNFLPKRVATEFQKSLASWMNVADNDDDENATKGATTEASVEPIQNENS